jgi:hypothetical protein
MPTKKKVAKQTQLPQSNSTQEFLVLGHLIKYNMYLLTKAVVFSAVSAKTNNVEEAVNMTHRVMTELDLDTKRRTEQDQPEETLQ